MRLRCSDLCPFLSWLVYLLSIFTAFFPLASIPPLPQKSAGYFRGGDPTPPCPYIPSPCLLRVMSDPPLRTHTPWALWRGSESLLFKPLFPQSFLQLKLPFRPVRRFHWFSPPLPVRTRIDPLRWRKRFILSVVVKLFSPLSLALLHRNSCPPLGPTNLQLI